MKTILFALPGNEKLARELASQTDHSIGQMEIRRFPDGETFVKILSEVKNVRTVVVCTLDRPDDKLLPLYFICRVLRDLGASQVELVAPYLAYMRQDKRFHPGEAVTSDAFAALLSGFIDRLVTVDPHLHRHHALSEIYSVPTQLVSASDAVSEYIRNNVKQPLLIGPDEESRQWVEDVAQKASAPFEVLLKNRKGDKEVEVSLPNVEHYHSYTPVLVDDIISTAHTMIETIKHLQDLHMKSAVCIGVHAVFAGDAFAELKSAGAKEIVSCNTIIHPSNRIDLSQMISKTL